MEQTALSRLASSAKVPKANMAALARASLHQSIQDLLIQDLFRIVTNSSAAVG